MVEASRAFHSYTYALLLISLLESKSCLVGDVIVISLFDMFWVGLVPHLPIPCRAMAVKPVRG